MVERQAIHFNISTQIIIGERIKIKCEYSVLQNALILHLSLSDQDGSYIFMAYLNLHSFPSEPGTTRAVRHKDDTCNILCQCLPLVHLFPCTIKSSLLPIPSFSFLLLCVFLSQEMFTRQFVLCLPSPQLFMQCQLHLLYCPHLLYFL